MLLRVWNTVSERQRLQQYVKAAQLMLQHDDSSGASRFNLDEDWLSLSSESSIDTVNMVLETTVLYGNSIYHCCFDPSINFMAPPLVVGDLDESSCIREF
jgi:hypothetical protein